ARRSSTFSRSSCFRRWRSSVVRPGRCPPSRSACRTQRRSASTEQPSFSATDRIATHCDGYSGAWSWTIRTARSRSSGEYLLGRPMGVILSRNKPSDKAGTVQGADERGLGCYVSLKHHSQRSVTMMTLTHTEESTAVATAVAPTLLLAFELGERTWKLGFTTGLGQRRASGRFRPGQPIACWRKSRGRKSGSG